MKKKTEIISLSLPDMIAEEMEKSIKLMGYSSRSELIRDSLRAFLHERNDLQNIQGHVDGVMIFLYDHEYVTPVSEVRHKNMNIFKSFIHSDLNKNTCDCCKVGVCCEVLIFSGEAEKARKAYYDLKSLKGVEQAKIFLVSSEKNCNHNKNK